MTNKKLTKQFISEISAVFSRKTVAQNISMGKRSFLTFLKEEEFVNGIESFFPINQRVDCEEILNLCTPVLKKISKEPKEGWLEFTYRRGIWLLYPHQADQLAVEEYGDGAMFLLGVMQGVFALERKTLLFDFAFDFDFLASEQIDTFDRKEEYQQFLSCWKNEFVYEIMRLGRVVTPFHTLEHISGVHYVAMSVAKGLLAGGAPIDLTLVSGAAAAHDIGKFGCLPNERVPYLHYYYTDLWCNLRKLTAIGNIAANHSTWDLEIENLSAESLVLIYADFRVKQSRGEDGQEITEIFSLEDSFNVILSKLDNVDEAKTRRYRFVYEKLKDFEDYMIKLGTDVSLKGLIFEKKPEKNVVLMDAKETLEATVLLSVSHNLSVMSRLNNERQFGNFLEAARSEKSWVRIRAYLNIFEEYFTYLTPSSKLQTLGFLYELLMHREGDIRRQAANIIANIIAKFNAGYKKELPAGAVPNPNEETSFTLWEQYIKAITFPDHKLTPQQKDYICYTLKIVVEEVLNCCSAKEGEKYLAHFLKYYQNNKELEAVSAFALLDTLNYLNLSLCNQEQLMVICNFAKEYATSPKTIFSVTALKFFTVIAQKLDNHNPCKQIAVETALKIDCNDNITIAFLQYKILSNTHHDISRQKTLLYEHDLVSDIFLDNLKSATPWIAKIVNIDLLEDQIDNEIYDHILHISAHLSNLIKVSERVAVRHRAGEALIKIAPKLKQDQRNEIAVELTKGLEVGEYEVSKYIPEYLGQLVLYLHPNELDEMILSFKSLLASSNDRIVSVALNTVGVVLSYYNFYETRFKESKKRFVARRNYLLGMLLAGLANYRETVRDETLQVIGKWLFATQNLTHLQKAEIYSLCFKKLLFLINESPSEDLTFYYRASALSHIYRFMSIQRIDYGELKFEEREKIAFFPGTFDPFTLSHKGIVREIRNLGCEVFLAVDEFSWSKKTQPHLIRRQIVNMSVADEFHVNIFPDDIPVNIATPADLKRLREVFPNKDIYVAVGSDVVANASSYLSAPAKDSIHSMNHIIFRRASDIEGQDKNYDHRLSLISGKIIELKLPTHLEDISSSRIRDNIDLNRDISNLIEPMVQEFIYQNSLYLREPQYKATLQPQDIVFEKVDSITDELLDELLETVLVSQPNAMDIAKGFSTEKNEFLMLRDSKSKNIPLAVISYRKLNASMLLNAMEDAAQADYLRQNAKGAILLIEGVYCNSVDPQYEFEQLLMVDVICEALSQDCGYCVFKCHGQKITKHLYKTLANLGFTYPQGVGNSEFFVVDMSSPVVFWQNLETTIKEPFSSNKRVLRAISDAHQKMQASITKLFPGKLVATIDAGIIHHRLTEMITTLNQVPITPTVPRKLGEYMCVPYGKILRGKVVPNTVTKTLHTDKVFCEDLSNFTIEPYPYYTTLESQIRTIKSFQRPVVLVDDILHTSDRWRALQPIIEQENVDVRTIMVGLLSGRGSDILQEQNRPVSSVYYIPNMHVWFVESTLYPFIGGDTVKRDALPVAGMQPSINMILPYASPLLLEDCPREAVFDFSCCCIENARDVLMVLEEEYSRQFSRNLTLSRLSEAVVLPLCPDKGDCLSYDANLAASVYLENDLQMLKRLKKQMI